MNHLLRLPAALALALGLALASQPAAAQDRVTLGWGRLFVNDALGDMNDRWQTGSYTISRMRGESWQGDLPLHFGELLEFRIAAQTVAPADLVTPDPDDRRYAGILTMGMHSHFAWQGFETSLGAGLALTGPQTGIGTFQSWAHELLGMDEPTVLDDQIGNAVYPDLVAELGREFALGGAVRLRPFAEARVGTETLVRLGGDLVIGHFGAEDLLLRDAVTGQRYRGIEGSRVSGLSLTLGGDVAQVFDSALLPAGEPAELESLRARLRAGLHWQGDRSSVFTGVTWLGPEFTTQPEAQIVGALNVNLKF